jgi:hypothetical protein
MTLFAKKQFEYVKPRISEIDVKVELLNERLMEFLFTCASNV